MGPMKIYLPVVCVSNSILTISPLDPMERWRVYSIYISVWHQATNLSWYGYLELARCYINKPSLNEPTVASMWARHPWLWIVRIVRRIQSCFITKCLMWCFTLDKASWEEIYPLLWRTRRFQQDCPNRRISDLIGLQMSPVQYMETMATHILLLENQHSSLTIINHRTIIQQISEFDHEFP